MTFKQIALILSVAAGCIGYLSLGLIIKPDHTFPLRTVYENGSFGRVPYGYDPSKLIPLNVGGTVLNIRQGYHNELDGKFNRAKGFRFLLNDYGYAHVLPSFEDDRRKNVVHFLISTGYAPEKIFSDINLNNLRYDDKLGIFRSDYSKIISKEIFATLDDHGNPTSIIRCMPEDIDDFTKNPQCNGTFIFKEDIVVRASFERANLLPRWKEIHDKIIEIVKGRGK